MKSNSANIIKSIRNEMGLNQEEMAEQLFISSRQLARIESGKAGMDVWQFITALELLGRPTEDFWLLYLDSGEYAGYRDYRRLKRQLNNEKWCGIKEMIADVEKSLLIKQPIVQQFVLHLKVIMDIKAPDEMMDALLKVMHISKPRFEEDKISEYRMTYNEISIALKIASCLAVLKKYDRAVLMVQAMIDGRESAKVSEEDKAILFPSLHYTLALILGEAGKYKESLKACQNAIEVCREYNNLRRIPEMLCCMAGCYHKLGEEEHIYKTHLVRAYHVAYGIGRNDAAAMIKEDALKYYGVVVP